MSLGYLLARRFVIGESRAQAIPPAHKLNSEGKGVILNVLGEHIRKRSEIKPYVDEYILLIESLKGLNAQISLKLSQFGQTISNEICISKVEKVLKIAKKHRIFVWFDMEDNSTLKSTLDITNYFSKKYKIGVVLQCYLKNCEKIAKKIKTPVRLVKGAYNERSNIVFKDKKDTDKMYKVMIDYFDSKKNLVTIATHDSALIDYALSKKNKRFSYAFLMGVRESLQNEIVKKKQKVFVYAPHGKSWFAYYYRRIKERKENLIFAIKSIFRP